MLGTLDPAPKVCRWMINENFGTLRDKLYELECQHYELEALHWSGTTPRTAQNRGLATLPLRLSSRRG